MQAFWPRALSGYRGAVLLPGGIQAGHGLPLWFLLQGVMTDISAGSEMTLFQCKFLEQRIQAWFYIEQVLILYLLDDRIELNGVASLLSALQRRI